MNDILDFFAAMNSSSVVFTITSEVSGTDESVSFDLPELCMSIEKGCLSALSDKAIANVSILLKVFTLKLRSANVRGFGSNA